MDNYDTEDKNAAAKKILEFYARMHGRGAEFFVDGTPVLWGEAAIMAAKEESIYMADYIFGESGEIEQIRLDKVDLSD